jgi:ABC-type branched-subunit amino acid transport system ATPase component
MSAAVNCENLRGGYGDTEILSNVCLNIGAGDVYALMGKNGAGKTTLAMTVLGVLTATSGRIRLFGEDATGWEPHLIAALGITCAPQENAFFQDLTVNENLRLGCLSLSQRGFQQGRDRVIGMFPFIGQRLKQTAGTLSGGEQAMVKVARALLPAPRLVLLDEVTEGLQPMTVDRVRDVLLADHRERETTLLVIEQNIEFVRRFAERFGLMDQGHISSEGRFSDGDAIQRISDHLSV